MKRRRRTEILINGSRTLVEQLAQTITDNYRVKAIQEPEHGLVMMKVRETSKKSLFYLGEALVTECKVQVEEVIGMGIVIGDQKDFAYKLAIIDAAFEAQLAETDEWIKLLESEEEKVLQARRLEEQSILKTKVQFETMDVS
ncbi:phosphonate C-P lyase system protein PhnG [Robertmurraya sp. DFI.2.37]|jgi:alpha-D-ribose 1-methylphosphonate 5-triphosphate synthase subunit PhnG|uniref:phosphonate C-P lyase system protein PhnG n=1 Tax=Robertmurraya sp. DFI.2.37 TaxID=3031819 RepID=UPI001247917E|nr:phosphonate C-P lyase system protein PhnG [Robertmurraya sp. DFI.2.37]MDF1509601.1 phosphonate C-P lyase system protein PhnG [Robertmurraya sp. DFI.2.37]